MKKTIKEEKIEIWGDGNNIRDYIYIDDVCRMLMVLFTYNGEFDTFNPQLQCWNITERHYRNVTGNGVKTTSGVSFSQKCRCKKIILNNGRIMSVHKNALIPIRDGLREYYDWLLQKKSKQIHRNNPS